MTFESELRRVVDQVVDRVSGTPASTDKVGMVLRELHRSETALARKLQAMAHRQHADHESVHVGLLLADWAAEHVRRVAEAGRKHDLDLDPDVSPTSPVLARAMESTGVMLGRRPESGLVLLAELRRVHLAAAGVSVDWEILGQAAQALKNSELLTLVQRCHPETLRTVRWANGRIKESAPQIIATH